MNKIRLRRMGAKKRPSYRIVVADSRSPRDGRFIEVIGHYDPLTNPSTIKLDNDRASYWLGVGAQPTDTVRSLLKRQGLLGGQPVASAADAVAPDAEPEAEAAAAV